MKDNSMMVAAKLPKDLSEKFEQYMETNAMATVSEALRAILREKLMSKGGES